VIRLTPAHTHPAFFLFLFFFVNFSIWCLACFLFFHSTWYWMTLRPATWMDCILVWSTYMDLYVSVFSWERSFWAGPSLRISSGHEAADPALCSLSTPCLSLPSSPKDKCRMAPEHFTAQKMKKAYYLTQKIPDQVGNWSCWCQQKASLVILQCNQLPLSLLQSFLAQV
jgi:hypothetical protein